MTIPKEQILELLRQRGQHDQVGQADGQLPDQVDPEAHGGLLSQFGLDPMELLSMFAGGGAGGGLGGALGGALGGGGEGGEGGGGALGGLGKKLGL